MFLRKSFTNLNDKTGENDGEKNEDKVHQVDVTTESVINRMLGANDNSSDASKRKDYLLDLESHTSYPCKLFCL
jgi:hypothetical protein